MSMDDIRVGGALLTDGCGFISKRFVTEALGLPDEVSLVQFRYQGHKGVVLAVPESAFPVVSESSPATGGKVHPVLALRPSQLKISSIPTRMDDFCVLRTNARVSQLFFNREILNLIVSLKHNASLLTADPTFALEREFEDFVLKQQLPFVVNQTLDSAFSGSEKALRLVWGMLSAVPAFWDRHSLAKDVPNLYREPFFVEMIEGALRKSWERLHLKFQLPLGQACRLLGCADPYGKLKDGQIYACIEVVISTEDVNSSAPLQRYFHPNSPEALALLGRGGGVREWRCITAPNSQDKRSKCIAVCRNPCIHPGDVQLCEGVDVDDLDDDRYRSLRNVVLFPCNPATTTYSIPSRCSGGDLDGDEFAILWDDRVTKGLQQCEHFDYDAYIGQKKKAAVDTSAGGGASTTASMTDQSRRSLPDSKLSERVADCTATCINNAMLLGALSNIHTSVCEHYDARACHVIAKGLVGPLGLAMDFPKIGIVPKVHQQVKDLIKTYGYPHYITRVAGKKCFRGHGLLSSVYDATQVVPFPMGLSTSTVERNVARDSANWDWLLRQGTNATHCLRGNDDACRAACFRRGIQRLVAVYNTAAGLGFVASCCWLLLSTRLGSVPRRSNGSIYRAPSANSKRVAAS